ncbi:MAG: prepilin-type N-terminal cleavage/methylation domain-containing protein [Candidatus Alcyoniella australis]|nr:prepilin-type N-terminal cleavage/methylation domain-containing protein [Candidatus Alcyoniella australis]
MCKRSGKAASRRQSGFSLIELLVALALALILVAVIYYLFVAHSQQVMRQERLVEINQIGRQTVESARDLLMMIGKDVPPNSEQPAIIWAAPYEIAFNANYDEAVPEFTDSYQFDALYSYDPPAEGYGSSAEMLRLYLAEPAVGFMSNLDYSYSDDDRVLYQSYNEDPGRTSIMSYGLRYDDGTMTYPNGEHPQPLFLYWGDFDLNPATVDTLWGNTSAPNDSLDSTEIGNLLRGNYSYRLRYPWMSSGYQINFKPPQGAVFINQDGSFPSNSEDLGGVSANDELDDGEDLNSNGRLDYNLLDDVIHRIEVSATVIAKEPDYDAPSVNGTPFLETTVRLSVAPRNLRTFRDPDCGDPPEPPTNIDVENDECGRAMRISFDRSPDDGTGVNDVVWYDIYKKLNPEEGGGSGTFQYYTFVPATGQASYVLYDRSIVANWGDPDFPISYTYQVYAVDCGNSRSTALTSAPEAAVEIHPNKPKTDDFYGYATSGFEPPASGTRWGSIMLNWSPSQSGGTEDPNVDEYWIYRSAPNELYEVDNVPIAKIDIDDADTSCANSALSDWDAVEQCRNDLSPPSQFFKFNERYYWFDEDGSPGRGEGGGSMLPLDSQQWGLNGDEYRYYYEVRAYERDGTYAECLSDPEPMNSDCGDYFDVQSCGRKSTNLGVGSSFSPPTDLEIDDASTVMHNGDVTARFRVTWGESLNDVDDGGFSEVPNYYYIYRTPEPYGFYDAFGDPNYSDMVVFVAKPQTASGNTLYWYDSNALATNPQDDEHKMFTVTSTMEPDWSNPVSPATDSTDPKYNLIYAPSNPTPADSYNYVYSVSAVYGDGSGTTVGRAYAPWNYSFSCPRESAWDCAEGELPTYIDLDANPPTSSQCNLVGPIDIQWHFSSPLPPDGTLFTVLARENVVGSWELVDEVTYSSMMGSVAVATHGYYPAASYIGQDPGTIYEYMVMYSDEVGCTRTINLGVIHPAGFPDIATFCLRSAACSPPLTNYDCDTGQLKFWIFDAVPYCRDYQTPTPNKTTTPADNIYYRVQRFPWTTVFSGGTWDEDWSLHAEFDQVVWAGQDPDGWQSAGGFGIQEITDQTYRTFEIWNYVDPGKRYLYSVTTMIDHPGNGTAEWDPSCTDECAKCPRPAGCPASCTMPCCGGVGQDQCNSHRPGQSTTYPWDDRMFWFADQVCWPSGLPVDAHPYYDLSGYPTANAQYQMSWSWWARDDGDPLYHNGNPNRQGKFEEGDYPFESAEFILLDWSISFSTIFGDVHWEFYIGDHIFEVDPSGYARTDFDGLLGYLFSLIFEFTGDFGYNICAFCIDLWLFEVCVTDFWDSCYEDMTYIKNHTFLWSNNNGINKEWWGNTSTSTSCHMKNIMVQYHTKVYNPYTPVGDAIHYYDNSMSMAFRGRHNNNDPSYWGKGFDHYQIEMDFNCTYKYGGNPETHHCLASTLSYYRMPGANYAPLFSYATPQKSAVNEINAYSDDDWWSIFYIVCDESSAPNANPDLPGADTTHVYFWAAPDNNRTWDWQYRWYNTPPILAYGSDNSHACYDANGVILGVWPDGPFEPTDDYDYETGRIGIYANPFVKLRDLWCTLFWWAGNCEGYGTTREAYDMIRVTEFCGQCPPPAVMNYDDNDCQNQLECNQYGGEWSLNHRPWPFGGPATCD